MFSVNFLISREIFSPIKYCILAGIFLYETPIYFIAWINFSNYKLVQVVIYKGLRTRWMYMGRTGNSKATY